MWAFMPQSNDHHNVLAQNIYCVIECFATSFKIHEQSMFSRFYWHQLSRANKKGNEKRKIPNSTIDKFQHTKCSMMNNWFEHFFFCSSSSEKIKKEIRILVNDFVSNRKSAAFDIFDFLLETQILLCYLNVYHTHK